MANLFIIGRIKDLLIVYGRNHSPDDIEATIQEITASRCVAIAVPDDDGVEQLAAIVELKTPDGSEHAARSCPRILCWPQRSSTHWLRRWDGHNQR